MSSTLNFACATALAVLSHVSAAAAVPQYQITYDFWQEILVSPIKIESGRSMNDKGVFIGSTSSDGRRKAFVFDKSLEYIIPPASIADWVGSSYFSGFANDINNNNQVVGSVEYRDLKNYTPFYMEYKPYVDSSYIKLYVDYSLNIGFIYADHRYYDLNQITEGNVGLGNKIFITNALLIADSGRIIAEAREFVPDFNFPGTTQYTNVRTILILDPIPIPIPEIAGWQMLLLGMSSFTFLTRRKNK